jgi:hypothetical protein
MTDKQRAVKEVLKLGIDWQKERAEKELDKIIEKTEQLLADLKYTKKNDYNYSNKEQFESMMNRINNFNHNLPTGQGVYEYYSLLTAQKFINELEAKQ